jgi:hypothetical protein
LRWVYLPFDIDASICVAYALVTYVANKVPVPASEDWLPPWKLEADRAFNLGEYTVTEFTKLVLYRCDVR